MQPIIPNAPTDNLYKFMAIFSLMLSFTLFLYSDYMTEQVRKEVIEFSKVSTVRFHELVEGYAKNKSALDMQLLQDKYDGLAHADGLKMLVSSKKSDYYKSIRNFGVPILLFISIIGFLLWYIKVQKHQDYILKHEANNIK